MSILSSGPCHRCLWYKPMGQWRAPETCTWTHDDDEDSWDATCGGKFSFIADGPIENEYKHCPSCGKPIVVQQGEKG